MKKEYMKPVMRVIELKKQGCLLSGSYTPEGYRSVKGLNSDGLDWENDGFNDYEEDY